MFDDLYLKYKSRGVLIDTQLLLLYFVGCYSLEMIGDFKRTKMYSKDDFNLIQRVFDFFEIVVATPNVLTEVSNLANQLPKKNFIKCMEKNKRNIEILDEQYIPSKELIKIEMYNKLGLADTSIFKVAYQNYLVFTDDHPLYMVLNHLEVDAVNINHIRNARWFGGN